FGGVGPERLQEPHDPEAGDLSGQYGLHEGRGDEGLSRETIDFIRVRLPDRRIQRGLVDEVPVEEGHVLQDVLDISNVRDAQAADEPIDLVAFLRKGFNRLEPSLPVAARTGPALA